MRETTTNDIERMNVLILVIGSIASAVIMRDYVHFFSFAVASAIMTVNFRLLRKTIEGVFGRSVINKKGDIHQASPHVFRTHCPGRRGFRLG